MPLRTAAALSALLAVATPLAAQTSPGAVVPSPGGETRPPAASETPAAGRWRAHPEGAWLADELMEMDVHDTAGRVVASVEDLVLDRQGRIAAIVLAVGGTLGVGERKVAVRFGEFVFADGPAAARAAAADEPASTDVTTPGGTNRDIGAREALSNSRAGTEDGSEAAARHPSLGARAPSAEGASPPPTGSNVDIGAVRGVEDRNPDSARRADRAMRDQTGSADRSLQLQPGPGADAPARPYRIMLNVTREALEALPAWTPPT